MNIINFLNQNVMPATGCTEPVAVGYATALAYYAIQNNIQTENGSLTFNGTPKEAEFDRIKSITIKTDRDVYKNALSVCIPGTNGSRGMAIASAIGMYCNPLLCLNLFNRVNSNVLEKAKKLLSSGKVQIEEVTDNGKESQLDIGVNLIYQTNGRDRSAYARLLTNHNHISEIRLDNQEIYSTNNPGQNKDLQEELPDNLEDMLTLIDNISQEEIDLIYQGIDINKEIALAGLTTAYGLNVGQNLQGLVNEQLLSDNIVNEIRIKAAAAGDARMGGANIPVMSTAGSGNQGITALIPISVISDSLNIDRKTTCKAALLSHLVTKYASIHSGYLSAICGCTIKAGIGAAAGAAYLLGGKKEEINNAINIMAANLTGVICDGAKEGCALKLSTAAGTAAESALLAIRKLKVYPDNGIIFEDALKTIRGIGKISYSMIETDLTIVKLMQSK